MGRAMRLRCTTNLLLALALLAALSVNATPVIEDSHYASRYDAPEEELEKYEPNVIPVAPHPSHYKLAHRDDRRYLDAPQRIERYTEYERAESAAPQSNPSRYDTAPDSWQRQGAAPMTQMTTPSDRAGPIMSETKPSPLPDLSQLPLQGFVQGLLRGSANGGNTALAPRRNGWHAPAWSRRAEKLERAEGRRERFMATSQMQGKPVNRRQILPNSDVRPHHIPKRRNLPISPFASPGGGIEAPSSARSGKHPGGLAGRFTQTSRRVHGKPVITSRSGHQGMGGMRNESPREVQDILTNYETIRKIVKVAKAQNRGYVKPSLLEQQAAAYVALAKAERQGLVQPPEGRTLGVRVMTHPMAQPITQPAARVAGRFIQTGSEAIEAEQDDE